MEDDSLFSDASMVTIGRSICFDISTLFYIFLLYVEKFKLFIQQFSATPLSAFSSRPIYFFVLLFFPLSLSSAASDQTEYETFFFRLWSTFIRLSFHPRCLGPARNGTCCSTKHTGFDTFLGKCHRKSLEIEILFLVCYGFFLKKRKKKPYCLPMYPYV